MKISKASANRYFPSGKVEVFTDYSLKNPSVYQLQITKNLSDLPKIPPPRVGITPAKMKDIKSLQHYLTPVGRTFFDNYFSLFNKRNQAESSDDYDSCSE